MEQQGVLVSDEQAPPQDADPLQGSIEAFLRRWLERFLPPYLFRTLFQMVHKMTPWVHTMIPVETTGPQDIPSPDRLFWHTKEQLGTMIRSTLAFVPSRLRGACKYLLVDSVAGNLIPEEIKKMLVTPSCRGRKRSQANLSQEEKQCWVEAIQGDLPDEDDPEDSSYETTKSEGETDEYKSQNDTETDLEIEEKDGVRMLKEQLNQQDEPSGCPEAQELKGSETESRSSGDGSDEPPGKNAASSSGQGQTMGCQAAGVATQIQEAMESRPASEGPDTSLSSDSQEQWVDLSE